MTILLGSNAYSPFRLDAIRDAIAKLAPKLGPVTIDAKWIYAGVRRDGPVVAEGRFTMKRIAKDAEIEE